MARKSVAPFPPPTDEEAAASPDLVRKGPRGGWMWKCAHCGRPASHLTARGLKVCSQCGGSTARQRDPEEHAKAAVEGKPPPRMPGRPVKHGFYTTIPGQRVDELVAEYRERGLNPDSTDDDMLYLRAYLDLVKGMMPDAEVARENLMQIVQAVREFRRSKVDSLEPGGQPMPLGNALQILGRYTELENTLSGLTDVLKVMLMILGGIEDRHMNLVKLAKVRSETRFKDAAAQQLDVFTVMLERLTIILAEMLRPADMEAFQARLAKDLAEVPLRTLAESGGSGLRAEA